MQWGIRQRQLFRGRRLSGVTRAGIRSFMRDLGRCGVSLRADGQIMGTDQDLARNFRTSGAKQQDNRQ